ncbi:hypothetical protein VN97_g4977, partial [Penicillium thymicola]
MPQTKW